MNRTPSTLRILTALALASSMIAGCDDGSDLFDEDGNCIHDDCRDDDDRGQASNREYVCTTATKASTGTWWQYQAYNPSGLDSVPGFNNDDQRIALNVYKSATPGDSSNMQLVSTVNLNKTTSSTWSDGNLTVTLGLKSAAAGDQYGAKSIQVQHVNTGLTAGYDNGYCQEDNRTTIGAPDEPLIDTSKPISQLLAGNLKVPGSSDLAIGFRLADHGSDRADGYMDYTAPCSFSQAHQTPDGPSFPGSTANNIVSFIGIVSSVVSNVQCALDEDKLVTKSVEVSVARSRSQLRHAPPAGFCDSGSNMLPAIVWGRDNYNDQYFGGWMCMAVSTSAVAIQGREPNGKTSEWVNLSR